MNDDFYIHLIHNFIRSGDAELNVSFMPINFYSTVMMSIGYDLDLSKSELFHDADFQYYFEGPEKTYILEGSLFFGDFKLKKQ